MRPELHTTLFIAYVVVVLVVAQGGVSGRLGLLLLPVAAVRSRGSAAGSKRPPRLFSECVFRCHWRHTFIRYISDTTLGLVDVVVQVLLQGWLSFHSSLHYVRQPAD